MNTKKVTRQQLADNRFPFSLLWIQRACSGSARRGRQYHHNHLAGGSLGARATFAAAAAAARLEMPANIPSSFAEGRRPISNASSSVT